MTHAEFRPDEERCVALLKRLLAVDTQNPPGANSGEIIQILATQLSELGFTTREATPPMDLQLRHVPSAREFPRTNLIGRLDVGAAKTLHFNAHFDVVPASPEGWTAPPLELRKSAGWLYGRGTADMKGAIVAVLEATRLLRDAQVKPACNLEVSFVCDEESGSELGAAWLVRSGAIRPDFAVVCEGASGPRVCVGHNGTLWFEVTVLGKSAHGSTPDRGVNAVEHAMELIAALRKLAGRIGRRSFISPDGFEMRATLNIGGTASTGPGSKINTVPASFSFSIDRRVLANEDYDAAEQEIKDCLASVKAKLPGLRYQVRCLERNRPCRVDETGALPAAVARAVKAVRRSVPAFCISTGFNDMHWFAADAGIPVVGYGPGGERFHGVDERTRVRDLLHTVQVYARLMRDFRG